MSDAISQLRARVRLMKPVRADDELGGAATSWSDEGAVWAWIAPAGGGESAAFDRFAAELRCTITIRHRGDVATGWRVIWGARAFRVRLAQAIDGARVELDCTEEPA